MGPDLPGYCGDVLVVGGFDLERSLPNYDGMLPPIESAELYEPKTQQWTSVATLNSCDPRASADKYHDPSCTARGGHSATLLPDGSVLIAGGLGGGVGTKMDPNKSLTAAEVYNPATNAWRRTGSLAVGRQFHSTSALEGPRCAVNPPPAFCGRVLAAGGLSVLIHDSAGQPVRRLESSAELYDPGGSPDATSPQIRGAWGATAALHRARAQASFADLPNGDLLVAGGCAGYYDPPCKAAEIYSPPSGTWTDTNSSANAYGRQTAGQNFYGGEAITRLDGPACTGPSPAGYCGTFLETGAPLTDGSAHIRGVSEIYRPAPDVTALVPDTGPRSGGTPVSIMGSRFTKDSVVKFDGVAATITSVTTSRIDVMSPPRAEAGLVEVAVSDVGGSSTAQPSHTPALFAYNTCGETGASQVCFRAGGYSLIGVTTGTNVPADSLLYGWFDRNSGSYDSSQPNTATTQSGHGYWAYFAVTRPTTMSRGTSQESFPLGAYDASMVGNPSATSEATATGQDFAARWDPNLNGGAGGYHVSRYQEAQQMPVGSGLWVFSFRDTIVNLRATAP
ncbi:MAG: kelch repeat-containing protein [Candidatus Dormibacteria bacterium]